MIRYPSSQTKASQQTKAHAAQLAEQVNTLTAQLEAAKTAETERNTSFLALQETMNQQVQALEEAFARIAAAEATAAAAAEAQATAQAAAFAQAHAPADGAPPPAEDSLIHKPDEERFNICEAMQISKQDFLTIRATIHNLVKSTQLKWREDFRNQDPVALGQLFRAARQEHPILKRYINNWATAAIARTYMQNMRKYARKWGYISAWQVSKNASGSGSRHSQN